MWKFFTSAGAEKKVPASVTPILTSVAASVQQTLTTAVWTAVTFGTELIDTDGMWSSGSPTRLTVATAGRYDVHARIGFNGNATGVRDLKFYKNGVALSPHYSRETGSATGNTVELTAVLDLVEGDYIEVYAFQNSGGNLAIGYSADSMPYASMVRLNDAVVSYVGVPGSLIGQELLYAEKTTSTAVTATAVASATTIITAPPVTFNGTDAVLLDVYFPAWVHNLSRDTTQFFLFEDGAVKGQLSAARQANAFDYFGPISMQRRFVPTAGSHTYSIRGTVQTGTATIEAGTGVGSAFVPSFIRITRVA